MKSLLSIIQSQLHIYTYDVYPYACMYKMTRDNLIVPLTRRSYEISRRKWILLFEQQISLLNLLIEKNCTMTKHTYAYTRGCLLTLRLLLLHLIESIVSFSLFSYYHARLACCMVFVECVTPSSAYRWWWWTTEMVTPDDTICSMYQLKQHWKKFNEYISLRVSPSVWICFNRFIRY